MNGQQKNRYELLGHAPSWRWNVSRQTSVPQAEYPA